MNLNPKELIRDLVQLSWEKKNPHLSTCLSALPIICECYNAHRDGIFVLSKGHAWYALAVVLRKLGYNPNLEFTHPEMDVANGVWCTTGSLGHGLPTAIGLAIANPEKQVSVLLGDNECMEGTLWESLNVIQAFHVTNITVHVDCNGRGATDVVFNPISALLVNLPFMKLHRTVRGQGIKYCEAHQDWHKHDLTEDDYKAIMQEINNA